MTLATTNVPQPTFGTTGFVAPTEAAILAGVLLDFQAAFGSNLNPSLATPQGQLAQSLAALIGNVYDTFLYQSTQTDPAFAVGRWQDAIGRLYFIQRQASISTTIQVFCVGKLNVVVPTNALLIDNAGNTYTCTGGGTFPASGNLTLTFANLISGPIPVPTSVTIYQSVPGWDSVSVVSGVIGRNAETPAQFELRRSQSTAANSAGSLPSILGAILTLPGVVSAYVTENVNNTAQTIGGVTLNSNSLYVAVQGGVASAIAQAIWARKAPGCAYNGNTTVTVLDQSAGYTPPYPAYSVSFQIPLSLPFVVSITIANTTLVPANALTLIQTAIVNAFSGLDGGPAVQIGTKVFSGRFVPTLNALGPWINNQVASIYLGTPNTAAAVFVGSISGTTLTVSSVTSGTITSNLILMDITGNIIASTLITGGSGLSWTVNYSQTVLSETMYAVSATVQEANVNINQFPTISPANVYLTLA